MPGQLRGCALSLQRTMLRTSRHPAHRAHPNTPLALLSAGDRFKFYFPHSARDRVGVVRCVTGCHATVGLCALSAPGHFGMF